MSCVAFWRASNFRLEELQRGNRACSKGKILSGNGIFNGLRCSLASDWALSKTKENLNSCAEKSGRSNLKKITSIPCYQKRIFTTLLAWNFLQMFTKKLQMFKKTSNIYGNVIFFSRNRFLLEAFCTDLTTSEVKFSSRHSLFYKQILRFFEACLKIIHKSCKMGLCFKLATGSNKNIFQNSIAKLELKLKKQAKFSKLIELLNIIWVVKWTTFEFCLKFILIEIINGNANKLASQSGKLFCTGSS